MLYYDSDHSQRATLRILGFEHGQKPAALKPGRNWTVEVYDPLRTPSRKYISLKTRDLRLALQRFAQLERDYRDGKIDLWAKDNGVRPGQQPLTCAAAVEAYLKYLLTAPSESGLPVRASTRRQRVNYLGTFVRTVAELAYPGALLTDVTPDHVRAFAYGRDLVEGSVTTQLNTLKQFTRWAVDRRHLRKDPAASFKGARSEARFGFFRDEELDALVACIRARIRADERGMKRWPELVPDLLDMVLVAVGTGLRLGELCCLRWEHVDLTERVVHVADTKMHRTKTSQSRSVPLAGDALAALEGRRERDALGTAYVFPGREGGPFRDKYVSAKVREFIQACGLGGRLTFHSLRHTFATRLARAGVPEYTIQCLLGHRSNRMTQRYMHAVGVDTRGAIERVFGTAHFGTLR